MHGLFLCRNNRFWTDMLGLFLCGFWSGVCKFMDWYVVEWTTVVWTILWGWLVQTLGFIQLQIGQYYYAGFDRSDWF